MKKRRKKIQSLLRVPRLKCTPETFHKLRVEIKKLITLLSLLKYSFSNFHRKKIEKPFRKIFKQAGKMREIQVEEDSLQKYFSVEFLSDYREKLKENKSKELRNYIHLAGEELSKVENSFIKIKPWLSITGKKEISAFIDSRKDRITLLFDSETIQPSQIHLLRKRIKQYNYALRFSSGQYKVEHNSKLDVLGDLTGKWHDEQVLLNHLDRQIHSPGIHRGELEELQKIRNEQVAINNITFNQIKNAMTSIKDEFGDSL